MLLLTALNLLQVPQVFHSELQDISLFQFALSNLCRENKSNHYYYHCVAINCHNWSELYIKLCFFCFLNCEIVKSQPTYTAAVVALQKTF